MIRGSDDAEAEKMIRGSDDAEAEKMMQRLRR